MYIYIHIYTGANSGCGKETARLLFSYNATVIMACRDVAAGDTPHTLVA